MGSYRMGWVLGLLLIACDPCDTIDLIGQGGDFGALSIVDGPVNTIDSLGHITDGLGNIYLSWHDKEASSHYFRHSSDQGSTWSESRPIPTSDEAGDHFIRLDVSPDGTLYAFRLAASGLYVRRSLNQGQDWEEPRAILDHSGYTVWDVAFVEPGIIYLYLPSLYQVHPKGEGVIQVARSTDGGLSWSVSLLTGQARMNFLLDDCYYMCLGEQSLFARPDGFVAAVFTRGREEISLQSRVSYDFGQTWSLPFEVSPVSIIDGFDLQGDDLGNLYCVWRDRGSDELAVARWTGGRWDQVARWPVPFYSFTNIPGCYVVCHEGRVLVFYRSYEFVEDPQTCDHSVAISQYTWYCATSSDRGATWTTNQLVDGIFKSSRPQIATSGSSVCFSIILRQQEYTVYSPQAYYWAVGCPVVYWSEDGGDTWSKPTQIGPRYVESVLQRNEQEIVRMSSHLWVTGLTSGSFVATWQLAYRDPDGNYHPEPIWVNRSGDGGRSWGG